jgi:tetratricopeptide (TPR) repeat protein
MKCYQIRIQYLPYEQKEIARTLDHIAAVYNDKDDLSNAMIYHEKSFKINEICLPVEHDLIGSNLNNIATILTNQGKYNEAFEYFEKALKNEKQNCIKPNLIRLARNYDNMGICLCDQDNEKIGLEYRMKAVKLIDQVSPRIQHADWIDNVGNEFFKKEFYDCALECYLISLNMKLECLSNDHIDIADSLMVLGDVYVKKNFKIQARFYYEKSLIIYESKEHFNTIDVLNCIGMIYENICKYYLALEYYKKALAFSEKYYPADNSVKTTNENNIARIKWFIK